jgi:hypothetical protein
MPIQQPVLAQRMRCVIQEDSDFVLLPRLTRVGCLERQGLIHQGQPRQHLVHRQRQKRTRRRHP